jgi:hypothetical protein
VATVTGLDQTALPGGNSAAARAALRPAERQQIAPPTASATSSTATYQCSQYWGQHTENLDSQWASTCGALQSEPGIGPDPEEALDVESVRTPAIHDVPAVSAQHPPILFGQSIYSDGNNNLTTIGEDQPPLQSTAGYDDVTGLGAATASFVTAFPKRS